MSGIGAVGQVLGFINVLIPVWASIAAAVASVIMPNTVWRMLYVDGMVFFVVVWVGNDFVCRLRVVGFQAPGDEEDDGEDQGDLGCG